MIAFLYILAFIYSISFYYPVEAYGAYCGCGWINYLACNIIHTNLLHLILNCTLLYVYWGKIKMMNRYILIPILALSSIAASMLSVQNEPTIGASAIVMAMIGVITAFSSKPQKMRILAIVGITCLITGLIAPHVNTLIHACSYTISLVASFLMRRFLLCLR